MNAAQEEEETALPGARARREETEKGLPADRQPRDARNGTLRLWEDLFLTRSLHRVRIALDLPDSVPSLLSRAAGIVEAVSQSSWFPSPNPPLATLRALIDTAADLQARARLEGTGAATRRDVALRQLRKGLDELGDHVRAVAEANPDVAGSIVGSAQLRTYDSRPRAKPPLVVRAGPVAGSAVLVAKAQGKRASYKWQMSRDGGRTWIVLPSTLQAKTTVKGLVPGTTVLFRMRVTTSKGVSDWGDPVEWVVR